MKCLNKVLLIGFVGNNPIEKSNNNILYTNFSVATSTQYKQDGETKEKTEWHRIVAFGKLAEICIKYLKKGSKVFIEGSLQKQEYEKDGIKQSITYVKLNNLIMLDNAEKNVEETEEIPF